MPLLLSSVHTNDAFRYHWSVWKYTGIHAPSSVSKRFYFCYAVLINLFVTILFPLTLIANIFHSTNLQQLCENLTITITDTIANLKFLNVFFVRSKLLKIKSILSQLDSRARLEDEFRVLRSSVRIAQNSFRVFWCIYTLGIVLSLFKVGISNQRILLYPAWFQLDWEHSNAAYAVVFAYQMFGLVVQAVQDCANDSYPPAYLCVLTGHMRALELRVRKIGAADESQLFDLFVLERNFRELVACIEDHLMILNLHKIIQEIISIACLAQFICSALVQCTVGLHFLFVVDSNDLSALILSIIFFIAVTLEVFIICLFGHYMRQQSEDLTVAFYSCNWIEQLPRFKKNLIIAMLRSQRTCVIHAGNYVPVDLSTFLQLMKYTYSAFTLLMKLK